ncbi:MAG: porphobilinogen synthase [Armatimonadota bacterium]
MDNENLVPINGRLRRLRRNENLRRMVRETHVSIDDLVYPIFVVEGFDQKQPIDSMPGQYRWSVDRLPELLSQVTKAGIPAVLLFGLPIHKTPSGKGCIDAKGPVPMAIRSIQQWHPDLVVITDVCVCAYTDHGHCGVLDGNQIDNDASVALLTEMALVNAQAGADVVAPSAMMDGQVAAIRHGLDSHGFSNVSVMAYAAKFASAFYGPFREAAHSAPAFGDRRSYQMDPPNAREAELELREDEAEGADWLMVKPGLAYLDLVAMARRVTQRPVVVYNVSGEYAMVKAAAQNGWIDERKVVMETMVAFKRAGADVIITYHALDVARWMKGDEG